MWSRTAAVLGIGVTGALAAHAEAPLSAIDWLSESLADPAAEAPAGPPAPSQDETAEITVTPLDTPVQETVGLLPPGATGLPRDLWAGADPQELAQRIRAAPIDTLAAGRELLYTLLLAEAPALTRGGEDDTLFLARVDKLVQLGALQPAAALLDRARPGGRARFRRRFEVALLRGRDDAACAAMRASPGPAFSPPARVFCLARGGDGPAAALALETGKALGEVASAEARLLAAYLDTDAAAPGLPRPSDRIGPLQFRLFQAAGARPPTRTLPRAFAWADLRPTAGWRARIEAAERLTRSGAIAPERLRRVYTAGRPAASGGLWDRVAAVRRLDAAVEADDAGATAAALPAAWQAMRAADLAVAFADLYGDRLARMPLHGSAAELAFRVGLLSPDSARVARAYLPTGQRTHFLQGLALGELRDRAAPGETATAVRRAFLDAPLSDDMQALFAEDRIGEALLDALGMFARSAEGDVRHLSEALAVFRRAGFETVARRAALELMILGPDG